MFLELSGNNISDVGPLSRLNQLEALNLAYNPHLSDIEPLTDLVNLNRLGLSNTSVTDIQPLVENGGLAADDKVFLRDDPLSDASLDEHIPQLEERGVAVFYDGTIVTFNDANLEAVIRRKIENPQGPIYKRDLRSFRTLSLYGAEYSDLSGLEHFPNLERLSGLSGNISDLSPVSGLTNLISLSADRINVSDLSPLSGLVNLRSLSLKHNNITDVSPLSGLVNLEHLSLSGNNINDVSPLSGLVKLEHLGLGSNHMSDVTSVAHLSGLVNLTLVYLAYNEISDVSPLSGVPFDLNLSDNPLSVESVVYIIPQIRARGVTVYCDRQYPGLVNSRCHSKDICFKTALGRGWSGIKTVIDGVRECVLIESPSEAEIKAYYDGLD